jgi:uncharacterized sulfatase
MPHKPFGQHVAYMFQTPTTRAWKQLHDQGKLTAAQDAYWKPKPPEELYDLRSDPDEVHNLAGSEAHQAVLKKLRQAQKDLAAKIRDVGFLPEGELHSRSKGSSPYDMGHDDSKYPFRRIFETAEKASLLRAEDVPALRKAFADGDSAVRYWAALGMLMRGKRGVEAARAELQAALGDRSPYVRIAAAEALGRYGSDADLKKALAVLVELGPVDKNVVFVATAALNALDDLGDKAASVAEAIKKFPDKGEMPNARYAPDVPKLLQHLRARFQ